MVLSVLLCASGHCDLRVNGLHGLTNIIARTPLMGRAGDNTMRCGRHEPMNGLTTNEIAAFVALALLLALVLAFLLR